MPDDIADMIKAVNRAAKVLHRTKADVMREAAKGTVSAVVLITPPASRGATGAAAKEAGEKAIVGDLYRIFQPMSETRISAIVAFQGERHESKFGHKGAKALGTVADIVLARGQMAAFHQARRRKDGRVGGIRQGQSGMSNRERAAYLTTGLRKQDLPMLDIGIVRQQDFNWFLKLLQNNVGWLVAGWNKAAEKLGIRMPKFAKRHSGAPGIATEKMTLFEYRLVVGNEVGFVDNVRDYDRRIDKAFLYEIGKLDRRSGFLIEKSLKEAGFK